MGILRFYYKLDFVLLFVDLINIDIKKIFKLIHAYFLTYTYNKLTVCSQNQAFTARFKNRFLTILNNYRNYYNKKLNLNYCNIYCFNLLTNTTNNSVQYYFTIHTFITV